MKEYVLRPSSEPRKFKVEYEKELNEHQLRVATAGEGPLLVIAGAGSGKTRTLTYRVSRLVESGIPAGNLLLLTFTNKAAREMLSRVERLLGTDLRTTFGGTFHHVANMILRRNADRLGYRDNFTILDREDSKDLLHDCSARFHERHQRFPRADVLLEVLSYAVNTGTPPGRLLEDRRPEVAALAEDILHVFKTYRERKRRQALMDFDDLLVNWLTLLQEHPEALKTHQAMFRHILVDEYQDTNRLQSDIVEIIAGREGNLMVVGDDAQSIYSFRGANFANIIDFPKRFPKCQVFKLEVNYRSTPEILRLANSSIINNRRQFHKVLRAVLPSGPKPDLVACKDASEQARFVTGRILELHHDGMSLRDMAVLYRAHYHSLELQLELQAAGVPFEVRSGMRFFEQAHIKDVTSFMKIALNGNDELAWKRVLKLFPKIGGRTADRIWEDISKHEDPIAALSKVILPKGAQQGIGQATRLLQKIGTITAPSEMIRVILEEGYRDYLVMTYPNATARADDIRRLSDFALRFPSVADLLAELILATNVQTDDSIAGLDKDDVLVLSTVHQAKGLEWKAVFMLWLVEGKFPDQRSCLDEDSVEEERRLFYVAATRAKTQLTLCYPLMAAERSFHVMTRPSRFIEELDPQSFEECTVKYEG